MLLSTASCSPGMLRYLMAHNCLPDAMFNDIRGREHGRQLVQENMEFIARCMRRDIVSDEVVRLRTAMPEKAQDIPDLDRYSTKLSYEKFVEQIAAEKTVLSKARKEWRVVRANPTTTVIRDVDRRKEYKIPTRNLYEAHLHLDKDEIQIAKVAPFVGKENAPAASALLYNIVGQGQTFNYLRKHIHELFKQWDR